MWTCRHNKCLYVCMYVRLNVLDPLHYMILRHLEMRLLFGGTTALFESPLSKQVISGCFIKSPPDVRKIILPKDKTY